MQGGFGVGRVGVFTGNPRRGVFQKRGGEGRGAGRETTWNLAARGPFTVKKRPLFDANTFLVGKDNAQKRTKKRQNTQKCTKTRHFAQTHATPPFIVSPLACTQTKTGRLNVSRKTHLANADAFGDWKLFQT